MSNVLSFPFRLSPNGTAATVDQGTEQYYAEQINVLVSTDMGERPLLPNFGVPMMEFHQFAALSLIQACRAYLPEVEITDANVIHRSDARDDVVVTFDITRGTQ